MYILCWLSLSLSLSLSQVKLCLSEDELKDEIASLQHQKPHPIASQFNNRRRSSVEPNMFFRSSELSLLLQWCRAVCGLYGVPVRTTVTECVSGIIIVLMFTGKQLQYFIL